MFRNKKYPRNVKILTKEEIEKMQNEIKDVDILGKINTNIGKSEQDIDSMSLAAKVFEDVEVEQPNAFRNAKHKLHLQLPKHTREISFFVPEDGDHVGKLLIDKVENLLSNESLTSYNVDTLTYLAVAIALHARAAANKLNLNSNSSEHAKLDAEIHACQVYLEMEDKIKIIYDKYKISACLPDANASIEDLIKMKSDLQEKYKNSDYVPAITSSPKSGLQKTWSFNLKSLNVMHSPRGLIQQVLSPRGSPLGSRSASSPRFLSAEPVTPLSPKDLISSPGGEVSMAKAYSALEDLFGMKKNKGNEDIQKWISDFCNRVNSLNPDTTITGDQSYVKADEELKKMEAERTHFLMKLLNLDANFKGNREAEKTSRTKEWSIVSEKAKNIIKDYRKCFAVLQQPEDVTLLHAKAIDMLTEQSALKFSLIDTELLQQTQDDVLQLQADVVNVELVSDNLSIDESAGKSKLGRNIAEKIEKFSVRKSNTASLPKDIGIEIAIDVKTRIQQFENKSPK